MVPSIISSSTRVSVSGVEETPLWIPQVDALDVDGTRLIPPYFLGVSPPLLEDTWTVG